MIEIDKLFAYGCSFTSGEELMDHEVIDTLSEEEVDRIKRKYTNHRTGEFYEKYFTPQYCSNNRWFEGQPHDHFKHQLVAQKVREYQEQYAWPRWLADKIGVPWINRGCGGSSLDYSIFKLEKDLLEGNITENSLVVVAITAPNRQFWITEDGEERHVIYGHFNGQWWNWPNEKSYGEYIVNYANSKNMFWRYFQQLKYLDLLSARMNNRIVWFSVSCHWNAIDQWYGKGIENHITGDMFDSLDNCDSRLKDTGFFVDDGSYPVCGFGHAKYVKHIEVAETVYSAIQEKFA